MSALTYKAKDDGIIIIEDFKLEAPKTKQYVEMLENLKIKDKKTLLVLNDSDANVTLSARNIPGAKVLRADSLNTYEILNANKVVFVESSLKSLETMFSNKK
jgi:large subunit ribosomal protein L4